MTLGLRGRIVLIASAVIVLAVVTVTVAAGLSLTRHYERAMQQRSLAIAKSLRIQLERVLQYGIKLEDLAGFEDQCRETVRNYEGIDSAFVVAPDGSVLFHSDAARIGKKVKDVGLMAALRGERDNVVTTSFGGRDFYATVVPVLALGGDRIASVVITFPADVVFAGVRNLALYGAAASLVVLAAGIALMLGALAAFVTRPIGRLLGTVNGIQRGELDFSARVPAGASGEIGALNEGFNRLLDHIQQRDAQLVSARDQANAANEAKSRFLATMSHEIRTPMNGVLGMTELLLRSELGDKQRRFADSAHRSGRALLAVIDDILDLSKIEAGKLELEMIDFDLREAVEDAVGLLADVAYRKHLEIACWVADDVPAVVRGDPGRLRQVLTNLLSNATKFTERGEIVLSARRAEGDFIRFEVADTGIGIAPEVVSQLFERFRQADSSTSRRYGGSGLGLAIAKQLVGLMGGEIGVDSRPGLGSTFWFTALLGRVDAQALARQERPLDGMSVLVVEDNPTNRTILVEHAIGWGLRTESADNGASALRVLQAAAARGTPFDFALVDMKMPVMDGLALVHAVQADPALRGVRIVVLTSVTEFGQSDRAREAGLAWLSKPVRRAELYACLSGGAAEPASYSALPYKPAPARRGARLLLAEDNAMNQEIILAMLEDTGYEVSVVETGRRALEALEEQQFDAVLMDCQMPEMDGLEATRRLRKRETASGARRLPVIALTANAVQGDRERCLEAGMDDYLSKPLGRESLLAALESWTRPSAAQKAANESAATSESVILDMRALQALRNLQRPGRPDVVVRVLEIFRRDAPRLVDEMRRGGATGDAEALRRAAHTLKSTSASIGAARLSAGCLEIERLARKGDVTAARDLVESAAADLGEAFEALARARIAA